MESIESSSLWSKVFGSFSVVEGVRHICNM